MPAGFQAMKKAASLTALALSLVLSAACGNLEVATHERDGHRFYEDGKFDEAIAEYQKVLQLDPAKKEMYSYIARASADKYTKFIGTDKADETSAAAIKAWEKVKEVYKPEDTEFKEAESQINAILQQSGKEEQGVEYYTKLVEKTPSTGNYMLLADFLFNKELKFEDAIATVDQGLSKFPDDKGLLLAKSIYLWTMAYKQKDLPIDVKTDVVNKGMEAVEKCIAIPGQPEATPYSYRNLLYRQKAELEPDKKDQYIEQAKADVKKFQELWPAEKEWRAKLAGTPAPGAATPPAGS